MELFSFRHLQGKLLNVMNKCDRFVFELFILLNKQPENKYDTLNITFNNFLKDAERPNKYG